MWLPSFKIFVFAHDMLFLEKETQNQILFSQQQTDSWKKHHHVNCVSANEANLRTIFVICKSKKKEEIL